MASGCGCDHGGEGVMPKQQCLGSQAQGSRILAAKLWVSMTATEHLTHQISADQHHHSSNMLCAPEVWTSCPVAQLLAMRPAAQGSTSQASHSMQGHVP